MIRPETDDLIAFLNSLVQKDGAFMSALLTQWVPCNAAIADHESVQVFKRGDQAFAGILGVLNGFVGTIDSGKYAGWGPIAAVFDDDGTLQKFVRTEED